MKDLLSQANEKLSQADFVYKSYQEYLDFMRNVEKATDTLNIMLQSKGTQDTTEAIRNCKLLLKYGIP